MLSRSLLIIATHRLQVVLALSGNILDHQIYNQKGCAEVHASQEQLRHRGAEWALSSMAALRLNVKLQVPPGYWVAG